MSAFYLDVSLEYGPDFSRKKSVLTKDGVTQDTKYYIGSNYEVRTDAQGHQRKMNYLYGGDGLFAIYVQNSSADTMYYIQKNYLGSYYCVTNSSGSIVTMDGQQQVYSFDPWGRRRNATTWTYSNVPQNFLFSRGFTGHEHLDVFGLINMNGRCYDPWLGRMLSVDPIVDDLSNIQRFNGYTYANNNPMRFTDPTGYDGFDGVYTGPGMRAWVKPQQDGGPAFYSGGGGGGFHYNPFVHAYEDANGNIVSWNYVNSVAVEPYAYSTVYSSYRLDGTTYVYFRGFISPFGKSSWYTEDGNDALQNFLSETSSYNGGNNESVFNKDFGSYITNPYGIKETERFEDKLRFLNPLGLLTQRNFSNEITGDGTINIIHDVISDKIEVSYDAQIGFGSISLGNNGFAISVGITNNVEIGLNTDGIMIGYFSNRNGVVTGTEYSWKPSTLWYFLATSPVKAANPAFVY